MSSAAFAGVRWSGKTPMASMSNGWRAEHSGRLAQEVDVIDRLAVKKKLPPQMKFRR
jgi:hypothetical protein